MSSPGTQYNALPISMCFLNLITIKFVDRLLVRKPLG
jgi:hypothetical protein